MNRETYENLVRELEARSAASPDSYKSHVTMFSRLGAAYFVAVILFAVAMVALGVLMIVGMIASRGRGVGMVYIAFALVVGFGSLLFLMLQALWLRFPDPVGIELKESEFPRLFAFIRSLEQRFQARPIDHVILTSELNAAIVQNPRFGVFGPPRSFLVLGLALFEVLDADEFRSVIAHEFGHHSGNHSAFAARVYRSRETWLRFAGLYADFQERRGTARGEFLVGRFLNWFVPRFDARAFVLSRQNEYDADRCAAEVAGAEVAIRALARISIVWERIEKEFLEPSRLQSWRTGELPEGQISRKMAYLQGLTLDGVSVNALDRELKLPTDYSDTHPSLADRARSLGWDIRGRAGELSPLAARLAQTIAGQANEPDPLDILLPLPVTTTGTHAFLEGRVDELALELSTRWIEELRKIWSEANKGIQRERQRLAELTSTESEPSTDLDEMLEKASLLETFEGSQAALEAYRHILQIHPDSWLAHAHVGRLLLADGIEDGLRQMEDAVRIDVRATPMACDAVIPYLRERGRQDEERPWLQRYDAFAKVAEQAEAERYNVTLQDKYIPHSLKAREVRSIVDATLQEQRVQGIWLIRKEVGLFPDDPVHLLVVHVKSRALEFATESKATRLSQSIFERLRLSSAIYVVVRWKKGDPWIRKASKVAGSRLHPAP